MKIDFNQDKKISYPKIKVVGVGNSGSKAINHMIKSGINQIAEFVSIDTDVFNLKNSLAEVKLQIGKKITNGYGTGSKVEEGRMAAEESREEIEYILGDADVIFLIGGLGGGTATGAIPVIADLLRDHRLIIGGFSKPFTHEGRTRMQIAEEGISKIANSVDAFIVLSNDKVFEVAGEWSSYRNIYETMNSAFKDYVESILQMICFSGEMSIGFSNIKKVMKDSKEAIFGIGVGKGKQKSRSAVERAMKYPLLENNRISNARAVLLNITCNENSITIQEIKEIIEFIRKNIETEGANIIFGVIPLPAMKDEIRISFLATGVSRIVEPISSGVSEEFVYLPAYFRIKNRKLR